MPHDQVPGRAGWSHFSHAADMGVRAVGATREEVFELMALGMTAIIAEPACIEPAERVEIRCEAPGIELLLVDWLNALVYEMAVRRMLFSRFQVTLGGHALQAVAQGERVNAQKHHPAVEVKGVTYTALDFRRRDDGYWEAQCVVDV